MDPQTTLFEILAALAEPEPDRDEIAYLMDSLTQWIDRGGFLPIVQAFPGRAFLVTAERPEPVKPLPPKPF